MGDNEASWRPSTRLDYRWQLTNHLLPFFMSHRLSRITIAEVDRYKAAKVREGALSPTSINKTITRLAQILEVAVEYELIDRNPAKGRRRRVKASRPA
ncbi:MAG: tyrosine-type recombinase/integrase, partial [Solirubrobacteraceae bacterium]